MRDSLTTDWKSKLRQRLSETTFYAAAQSTPLQREMFLWLLDQEPDIALTIRPNKIVDWQRFMKYFGGVVDRCLLGSVWSKLPSHKRSFWAAFLEGDDFGRHAHVLLRLPPDSNNDWRRWKAWKMQTLAAVLTRKMRCQIYAEWIRRNELHATAYALKRYRADTEWYTSHQFHRVDQGAEVVAA